MENEETTQHSGGGGIYNYFQGATIHNLVINGNMTKNGPDQYNENGNGNENESEKPLHAEQVARALASCSTLIWGNAAYGVAFCVCRDAFNSGSNATNFERVLAQGGVELPEGTINAALNRNPWMRLNIEKWEGQHVMERVLRLRDSFLQAMNNIIIEKKVTA